MDKKKIDILLKKAYKSFSEEIDPKTIKKLIPIAFPVLQSTWKIKVAIAESSGLIERYILRVLKEFGPCDIKRIDSLLCLGEDRIENALNEMKKMGSPITFSGGDYSFAADGDIDHFCVEQEHEFTFCINGISGDLLPVDFCKKSKNAEIDNVLEEHPMYIKLSPIINGSESKLASLQTGTDAKRINEGIPDGFKSLAENSPRREYCRYFLAFAIVTTDEAVRIFCAGDGSIPLNSINNYVEKMPEIGRLLEKKDSMDIQLSGLLLAQKDNIVKVRVQDHTLWDCFSADDSSSPSVYFMMDFIRNGWLWDISNWKFSHYILIPEDKKTAAGLFICRASFELEHSYSLLDTRQDAENWLQDYYKRTNPSAISCPSLDEVLKPLEKSPSSEIRDFVRMMEKPKKKEVIPVHSRDVFHISTEAKWKDYIVDWLGKARKTIQIISPVIESDIIFEALEDANRRGVYLQVVTSLLDRKGRIKSSGDKQFSSMKTSGQRLAVLGASVRATKNIPHAKIVIIDKSVVLFMSANLNDNSLGIGNVDALETCIVLSEPSIVASALSLFDGIWECAQFVQGTDQKGMFMAQDSGKSLDKIPSQLKGKDECLIFSHPKNLALEKTIVDAMKSAEKEIILMAMSFYDMEQVPLLYHSLLELLSSKMSITLLVRTGEEQFDKSEWPDKSTIHLTSKGLRIIEVPHLHAKGVIVDDKTVLAMSANFNPYSLGNTATSHIECGLLAKSSVPWAKQFISLVRSLIAP